MKTIFTQEIFTEQVCVLEVHHFLCTVRPHSGELPFFNHQANGGKSTVFGQLILTYFNDLMLKAFA